jgi:hypothetical protein
MNAATHVSDEVRQACAWVAGRAASLSIDEEAIAEYARALPQSADGEGEDPLLARVAPDRETRSAFVICLDAINFGSGWWPTIRKREGLSGYSTIAATMADRFHGAGPWSAAELTELAAGEVAAALGQDPEHPLMADYARSLRDVGAHVSEDHEGRFDRVVDAAGGSALALADLLASWGAFADTSTYEDRAVPFFKRAQIAAADLDRAGVAPFPDRRRLTGFADNLVPHVLRIDGVLRLAPALEARIEAGDLLEHGSAEEVELRACAVHAVELLAAACQGRLSPPTIDAILWNRGRDARDKAVPRPRSRNTAY